MSPLRPVRPSGSPGGLGWLLLLLLAAVAAHRSQVTPNEPLTAQADVDGRAALDGFAAVRTTGEVANWLLSDGPLGVHAFRPLPTLCRYAEWRLWGECRWAYQVSNLLWLVLTGWALAALAATLDLPTWLARLAGLVLVGVPSAASDAVVNLLATLPDLCVGVCGLLAFAAALRWLADGWRGDLAWFGAALALALASKENAVALVPLAVCAALVHAGSERARRLALVRLALGLGAAWLVWHHLAELRMATDASSHRFGGLLALLAQRPRAAWHGLCVCLAPPLAALAEGGPRVAGLWPAAVGYLAALALLAWRRPALLGWVVLWKVWLYLPVLPLGGLFPWYFWVPGAAEPLLLAGAGGCLLDLWRQARATAAPAAPAAASPPP